MLILTDAAKSYLKIFLFTFVTFDICVFYIIFQIFEKPLNQHLDQQNASLTPNVSTTTSVISLTHHCIIIYTLQRHARSDCNNFHLCKKKQFQQLDKSEAFRLTKCMCQHSSSLLFCVCEEACLSVKHLQMDECSFALTLPTARVMRCYIAELRGLGAS